MWEGGGEWGGWMKIRYGRDLREVGEIKAVMRVMKLPVDGVATPGYRKKF